VLDGVGGEEEVSRWRGFDYYYDSKAIAEPSTYAHEAKYGTGESGSHPGLIYAGSGSSRLLPGRPNCNARNPEVSDWRFVPIFRSELDCTFAGIS
jgi:hypothetical protein